MSDLVLEVEDLKKTYAGDTKALKGVSFNIKKGELLSIIGPSGAGKSTLLRCINKMISPDEGSMIKFNNKDMTQLKKKN